MKRSRSSTTPCCGRRQQSAPRLSPRLKPIKGCLATGWGPGGPGGVLVRTQCFDDPRPARRAPGRARRLLGLAPCPAPPTRHEEEPRHPNNPKRQRDLPPGHHGSTLTRPPLGPVVTPRVTTVWQEPPARGLAGAGSARGVPAGVAPPLPITKPRRTHDATLPLVPPRRWTNATPCGDSDATPTDDSLAVGGVGERGLDDH